MRRKHRLVKITNKVLAIFFKRFTLGYMQQTIGERLQQARLRLGLSLDEASEKLKVRKDLLLKFENNEFNVKLPGIYARGFFRTYVKFLKLNEAELLAEYSNLVKDNSDALNLSLGHLQIEPSEAKIKDGEPQITEMDRPEESAKFVKPVLQFVYFKWLIGLMIVGLLGLVICICWHKKSSNRIESSTSSAISESLFETTESQTYEEITLVALEDVQVFVRQEGDRKRLFAGIINKGERRSIAKEDTLQISFSEGDNLLIERSNGTSIRPQKSGRGWIRLQ